MSNEGMYNFVCGYTVSISIALVEEPGSTEKEKGMGQSTTMTTRRTVASLLSALALMLAMVLASVAPALAQGVAQYGPPSSVENATFSFELAVECEPPANAEFLGLTATESLVTTPLLDPDGDGIYTGSLTVPKFAPGGPEEPITISPVRIVQGLPTGYSAMGPEYHVIKDFGPVKAEDTTLSAGVSFCDGGASDQYSDAGASTGTLSGDTGTGRTVLPDTGGALLITLGAGALLLSGGFLIRRFVR